MGSHVPPHQVLPFPASLTDSHVMSFWPMTFKEMGASGKGSLLPSRRESCRRRLLAPGPRSAAACGRGRARRRRGEGLQGGPAGVPGPRRYHKDALAAPGSTTGNTPRRSALSPQGRGGLKAVARRAFSPRAGPIPPLCGEEVTLTRSRASQQNPRGNPGLLTLRRAPIQFCSTAVTPSAGTPTPSLCMVIAHGRNGSAGHPSSARVAP